MRRLLRVPWATPPLPSPRARLARRSQRLAPVWDELADAVTGPVKIAKVDCTTAKDVCASQGVRGYPTLMFHKAGVAEPIKYSGARTLEALKSWAEEQ